MLRTKDICTLRPRGKFDRRQGSQEGPFTIITAWRIQIRPPPTIQISAHISLLEQFYSRDGHSHYIPDILLNTSPIWEFRYPQYHNMKLSTLPHLELLLPLPAPIFNW
jgi:hypothetical protein